MARAGVRLRALAHSWLMLEFPRDPSLIDLELQRSSVFPRELASEVCADVREELRRTACSVAATRAGLASLAYRR
ncbi:hypothetical protein GCM10010171_57700 [Actinokineospora fastidiosa]|uniref:Uncharacterized protein n=1 Tax=Actinokineospora fastidiosa TaxID=1816 RepID=A0A918LJ30_9PSEU|nr:hypothetical protein GCM10010171_57700 [Actinokineospora fastidiosa]